MKKIFYSIIISTFCTLGINNFVNAQSEDNDCKPTLFMDFNPGYPDSNPENFIELNGSLYFSTLEGLWKTDGTKEGTVLIDSFKFDQIKHIKVLNNEFIISTNKNPTVQLLKNDGNTTTVLKSFPDASGFHGIEYLSYANGYVIFTVDDDVIGKKLWRTDGTEAGTIMVKDIDPTGSIHNEPHELFTFNDNVYFRAGDATTGQELWKSDGTSDGTKMVKDLYTGLGYGFTTPVFAVLNNELYFYGLGGASAERHGLWKTDGTEAGTLFIKQCGAVNDITNINDVLYFSAYESDKYGANISYGSEPWISDGTEVGTRMIKDINPGKAGSIGNSYRFTAINSKVMFVATDGVHGLELWTTDGTEEGTKMIKEINTTDYSSEINLFGAKMYNGYLYFAANDGTTGSELWKTDGTEAGTTFVADLNTETGKSSTPKNFTLFKGNLFFTATNRNYGEELWSCKSSEPGGSAIQKIGLDKQITVYPNPTSGQFNIQFLASLQDVQLAIYDINGRKSFEKNIPTISQNTTESLNLSNFTAGIYLLKLETKTQQSTFRFVVTK